MCHKLEKGIIDLIGKELYMVCDSLYRKGYVYLSISWLEMGVDSNFSITICHEYSCVCNSDNRCILIILKIVPYAA